MSLRTGLPVFATLVPLLIACASDQPAYGSGSGELGKGSLYVTCTPEDAACEPGAATLEKGGPIAVGASFHMTYDGQIPLAPTGDPSTMILFSASPSMLSVGEDEFVAWLPGYVAVIARTAEGTVTDFTHVELAAVAKVELERSPAEASTQLVVGQQGVWLAAPVSSDDLVLAGSLAYTWEVDGTSVEVAAFSGRSVTLVARESGTSTLRAQTGEAKGETTITVEAAP